MSQTDIWILVAVGAIYISLYIIVGRMIFVLLSEKIKPITPKWLQNNLGSPKTQKLRLELGLKTQEEADAYSAKKFKEICELISDSQEQIAHLPDKKIRKFFDERAKDLKQLRKLCPTSPKLQEDFNEAVSIIHTNIIQRTFTGSKWVLFVGILMAVATMGVLAILPIGYYLACLTTAGSECPKDKMVGSGNLRYALNTISDRQYRVTRYADGRTETQTINTGMGYFMISVLISWTITIIFYPFTVAKKFYENYVY